MRPTKRRHGVDAIAHRAHTTLPSTVRTCATRQSYSYLYRVIFRTRRKNVRAVVLIADIHTFAHIGKRLRSKGGRGHFSFRIVRGEDGQAMAEYAVILGLIAATLILTYSTLGETTARLFESVVSQI